MWHLLTLVTTATVLLTLSTVPTTDAAAAVTQIDVARERYLKIEQQLWDMLDDETSVAITDQTQQLQRIFDTYRLFVNEHIDPVHIQKENMDDPSSSEGGSFGELILLNRFIEWPQLEQAIMIVNYLFEMFREPMEKYVSDFDERALNDFCEFVLFNNTFAAGKSLEHIQMIMVGQALYHRLMIESNSQVCTRLQSPQQIVYQMYTFISLAELKGYAMMQLSWMLLRSYKKGNYTRESQLMRNLFIERTKLKQELVRKVMEQADRSVWRCDPDEHLEGFTYERVHMCMCNEQSDKSDRYFNLREAVSDIEENKVVTGLRFRKVNRIVHLQIRQGELQQRGVISSTSLEWKSVPAYKLTDRGIRNTVDYHTMDCDKRAIDLDELHAPAAVNHVVTGIRFRVLGTHLNMEIRITEANFTTGKLIEAKTTSYWHSNNNTVAQSGSAKRTEVKLHATDISTRTTSKSVPTSKSNQYIEFTSTDIDTDVAQTTVPYLDAQNVTSLPAVALSGVGLYYKSEIGFGGFVAPKLFTYNFEPHIERPDPTEEK